MTHICVGKLTIIGSDNGLLPGRHQAIIWTNAGLLLIVPLGTNLSEILIEIENVVWKMAAILSWPQCVNNTYEDLSMMASYNAPSKIQRNKGLNNITKHMTLSGAIPYCMFCYT